MYLPRAIALLILATASVNAQQLLTKASKAFSDPGWSFHWSSSRGLGSGEYLPLEATDQSGEALYTTDGSFPSGTKGAEQLFLGTIGAGTNPEFMGETGGLPGAGSDEWVSGGVPKVPVLAYTVPQDGKYELHEGLLSNVQDSTDGLRLSVYINAEAEPSFAGNTDGGKGVNLPFKVELGKLSKGDIIYVAISPRANNWSDVFAIEYSVVLMDK